MFDVGGYKRLTGKAGSTNTKYFGILIALVVFFGLIYLYYSASSEADLLRKELEVQSEHISKLKNEILEGNVNLEKARSAESACQTAKSQLERKAEQCSIEQNKFKVEIEDLQTSLSEKDESIKMLNQQLSEQTKKLETNAVENAAMKEAGIGQASNISKLNEDIDMLKRELALKDDVIHGLNSKLGLVNDSPVVNHNQNATRPPVKQESENVIPQPKHPDEPEHLSAWEKPKEEDDEIVNPDSIVNPVDAAKRMYGGSNVVRSPQERWGMQEIQQRQDDEGEKSPFLNAPDNEKF